MANEQRLIDANALFAELVEKQYSEQTMGIVASYYPQMRAIVASQPTVDAVEVADKELLKAIKLLIKQYEHSKNSDYVHHPVAHAFFHTWKQLDGRRE